MIRNPKNKRRRKKICCIRTISSSKNFKLLYICYQLPTTIHRNQWKTQVDFKGSGNKPQHLLPMNYFKYHQYTSPVSKIRPQWKHSIHTPWLQNRESWITSSSWEPGGPAPAAAAPSASCSARRPPGEETYSHRGRAWLLWAESQAMPARRGTQTGQWHPAWCSHSE